MSYEQLPKKIDPIKFVTLETSLSGTINLEDMTRLSACIEGGDPLVDADLSFYRSEQGFRIIEGSCRAQVNLLCQRCLEPTGVPLEAKIALVIVSDDERAKKLPKQYDALILQEAPISLAEMVEEELLLCLPSVPRHLDEQCNASLLDYEDSEVEEVTKPNPFEVLSTLKKE